ncbi:RNA exonuclease 3 [Eremomyces bilateralis CBS 781.70]|uniref:RNA exonuclease 3 n=1 Tax=Eremomyces bilateralis CBS 781.70 TaxID=1392243 RepID=A0A6G1GAW2_9PEZI|nr:RNA exonuclease 3 [Eremomyces bilateralis CBS 781.70]KAF1815132.1 RNA exonuclease 3 [Eremomyces bilateralis CBS 781.70]
MFAPKGLFRNIPCPRLEECQLLNCLFSHDNQTVDSNEQSISFATRSKAKVDQDGSSVTAEPDRKRRRLSSDEGVSVPVDDLSTMERLVLQARTGENITTPAPEAPEKRISRGISPPPLKRPSGSTATSVPPKPAAKPTSKPVVWEPLNPRLVQKDPVGHGRRFLLLKSLYQAMKRLNDEAANVPETKLKKLLLHEGQLTKMALDEEEKLVHEGGSVYENLVRQRLFAYKKMKVTEWLEILEAQRRPRESETKTEKPIETGLEPHQEVSMVSRFKADQESLEKHGYVARPPTAAEVQAAREGEMDAKGWEECDRCKTRFQVFPDRRDDGALTSGGTCVYHWGKRRFPKREKTDATTGTKPTLFECCNEPIGSDGCTTHPTHVFKVSEVKRLAVVHPFEPTPDNPEIPSSTALAFDCEMGYTTKGMELIRLSAASWPEGKSVLDVLVKPFGAILDFNTRFSGVTLEQFNSAKPLILNNSQVPPGTDIAGTNSYLHIVSSPSTARSLFLTLISPTTPLIGHALENDLNALRLVHPTIIDTVLLFPHPHGLPIRHGLKNLAREWLRRNIQAGGADGHDSLEDARAAGDLVRLKIAREWRKLKAEGWRAEEGKFVGPDAKKGVPSGELPPYEEPSGASNRKRKSSY